MTQATIVLRLTRSQQMALTDVLIDYIRMPEHTEEFLDVANDVTTTPGDLLRLVSSLNEVELQETASDASRRGDAGR